MIKLLIILLLSIACSHAPQTPSEMVHPLFNEIYVCNEHYASQFGHVGDALGTDCYIQSFKEINGRSWMRSYKNNGRDNADWYGWNKPVLAPISGEIVLVNENTKVNKPGFMGKGKATFVVIKREDGLHATVAHLQNLKVQVGDKVIAGEVIGLVGNNGQSWHPHIHLGIWRDDKPLQVRFDQTRMPRL